MNRIQGSRIGIQMSAYIQLNFVQKASPHDMSFETLDELNHKV